MTNKELRAWATEATIAHQRWGIPVLVLIGENEDLTAKAFANAGRIAELEAEIARLQAAVQRLRYLLEFALEAWDEGTIELYPKHYEDIKKELKGGA